MYDGQRRRTDRTGRDKHVLRTSTEEEQKPSMEEEYDEEEPFEEYDKDESFEENDDEGKWTTQFSYPTEEEENTLFIAFMTGNVEDQKSWINAKMNLAKATTNEETRRREEEILNRIIPTGMKDLDKDFDEEEMDNLSESRTYDHDIDQEEDFVDYQVYHCSLPEQEEEDIQSSKLLKASYRDHERQNEDTFQPLSELDDLNQLDKARYLTELDVRWKYDDRPYSPTTSQAKTDKIFLDQKNERQIDIDNNSETKEQNTGNTRSVPRRSRDNDLFTESEGCTSWAMMY